MGAFASKEWSEVLTTGSPGSPDAKKEIEKITEDDKDKADNSEKPKLKHRIMPVDPRSVSDDVERTPIQIEKPKPELPKPILAAPPKPNLSDASESESDSEAETDTSGPTEQDMLSTPTNIDKHLNKFKALAIDPRSPSNGVNRTPIVVESPLLGPEDDIDTPRKAPEMKPPKRGMFAAAIAH